MNELTQRERDIARLAAAGLSNKVIYDKLGFPAGERLPGVLLVRWAWKQRQEAA